MNLFLDSSHMSMFWSLSTFVRPRCLFEITILRIPCAVGWFFFNRVISLEFRLMFFVIDVVKALEHSIVSNWWGEGGGGKLRRFVDPERSLKKQGKLYFFLSGSTIVGPKPSLPRDMGQGLDQLRWLALCR